MVPPDGRFSTRKASMIGSSGVPDPNWYEKQFGDRVRRIRKGGGSPAGPKRWNGGAVAGILIGIGIAVVRFADHSSPPTLPRFQPPQAFHAQAADEWVRIQKQLQDMQIQPAPFPPGALPALPDAPPEDPNALTEDEVPLWEGLCYRIDRESRQARPTPGRHICALLEPEPLEILRRAAAGARLDEDERGELLDALNEVLVNHKLYDAESFRGIPLPAAAAALRNPAGFPFHFDDKKLRQANRALVEAAYPEQIIPVRLKNKVDGKVREEWRTRALRDLETARKQFGSRK